MKSTFLVLSILLAIELSHGLALRGTDNEWLKEKRASEVYSSDDLAWQLYKTNFNKVYKTSHEEYIAKLRWASQVNESNLWNKWYDKGVFSWKKGINQFSDGSEPPSNRKLSI